MELASINFSKKEKRTVILAVTLGNVLEWYEIYLYVYWAPIISKLFFNGASDLSNLTHTFLVFAVGFLARPLGGIVFGRLGDIIGRKKSLILSIIVMIVPTFITGFLPTYAKIGIFAPWILGVMRFLQAFPAGGEVPGAICYLYESTGVTTRRALSSWAAVGYQAGIFISTVECYLLEKLLPAQALIDWGWRISFILGGLIGFLGLCMRFKLHETPLFKEMQHHQNIVKDPILTVLARYKKGIIVGILYCALNSSAFYLLSINLPVILLGFINDSSDNLLLTALFLVLVTIPLPFFGKLGDKVDNKKLLIGSTIGMTLLLYPLYFSIGHSWLPLLGAIIFIYGLLYSCVTALVPYIMSDLFPTYARFTCVGVSFNLADAIIGGFTPAAALYLLNMTGNRASFCWILLFCSLLSLSGYLTMRSNHHKSTH